MTGCCFVTVLKYYSVCNNSYYFRYKKSPTINTIAGLNRTNQKGFYLNLINLRTVLISSFAVILTKYMPCANDAEGILTSCFPFVK